MAEASWERAKKVYAAARRLSGTQRDAALDELCGDDADLRAEVESLLRFDGAPSHFLVTPSAADLGRALETLALDETHAPEVPGYRITGVLGRGGMGVVFEAEQENPRRSVAIKVLRPLPYHDATLVRLFEREIEALARLEHPGIAVIHAAGETAEGWPFFAMERVHGVPLHRFVRERALTTRERVGLFREVCDAMASAHRRGVVHRDLKPSNVLVTDDGQPKVLDFGLARLTRVDGGPERSTVASIEGHILGTLPFMSPEQAEGHAADVDARSDVYSLGVILFELLTGAHPYDLDDTSLLEAARIIVERPARSPRSIAPSVSVELEAIVLHALEKEPARRYPDAAALRDDVDRYLHDVPVLARPPSALYALRKLVARHRIASTLAALLALVLVASAVVTGLLALNMARERDAAVAAREAESAVSNFLARLFGQGDPHVWEGGEPSVGDLVHDGIERLDTELGNQPLARARLALVLGNVAQILGDFGDARRMLADAVDVRRNELDADDSGLQEALTALARLENAVGEHAAARGLAEECVAMARHRAGEPSLDLARAYQTLGEVCFYAGDHEPGAEAFRRAAELFRAVQPADTVELAVALNDLGACLQGLGRLDEAEGVLHEALEMKRRVGDDPTSVGWTLEALAHVAHARGDSEATLRLLREQVELFRSCLYELHPSLAFALANLGMVTLRAEGPEAAEPIVSEALRLREQGLGENHPSVADSLETLATIRLARGLPEDAVALQRRAVDIRRATLGPQHRDACRTLTRLGVILHQVGALDESIETLLASHEILERTVGEADSETVRAVRELVAVLEEAGDTIGADEWRARLP